MAAASIFIKVGGGVFLWCKGWDPEAPRKIHWCVCVCLRVSGSVWCGSSRHLTAVTDSVCQPEEVHMFSFMSHVWSQQWLTLLLSCMIPVCLLKSFPTFTGNKVKVKCISCGLPRGAFPPPPHHTGFLLQPACGLLYYSWTPYCFWLMQNACFPPIQPIAPIFSSPV